MRKLALVMVAVFAVGCSSETYLLGLGAGDSDGGAGGDLSTFDVPCAWCSTACRVVSAGWPALRDLQTDGESVYLMNGIDSGASLIRVAADDTVTVPVANRPIDWGMAVGPNTLVWKEGMSPSVVFTQPSEGAGASGPTARALIDSDINDVAVVDADYLYYVPSGTMSLTAMPLAGGLSKTIATVTSTSLVDVDANAVYYYDVDANVTRRQPKDGSPSTVLAAPVSSVAARDSVNFYDLYGSALYAIPRDGSAARTLVSWPTPGYFYSAERQVATDGVRVYYIDQLCTESINTGCAIRSVPVGGGDVSTLCSSIETPVLITANANAVYFSDGSNVMRLAPTN